MGFGDWTAVLALAVSAASFGFNFWFNNVNARIDCQPVLSSADTGEVWELRNIGNGPTLNIIVQKKYVSGPRAGTWDEPAQIPDLGKDKSFPLHWLGRINDVGLELLIAIQLGAGAEHVSETTEMLRRL